jgi:hypothetical protein
MLSCQRAGDLRRRGAVRGRGEPAERGVELLVDERAQLRVERLPDELDELLAVRVDELGDSLVDRLPPFTARVYDRAGWRSERPGATRPSTLLTPEIGRALIDASFRPKRRNGGDP